MLTTLALAFALSLSPLACGDKDDDTATSDDGGAVDGGSSTDGGSTADGGSADGGTAGDGGAASGTAYAECTGADGECATDEDCLGLDGIDNPPFCSPQCGDGSSCPDLEGYEGTCALVAKGGDSATNCVVVCSLNDLNCPTGMECVDVGQESIGICLWPA